MEEIKKLKETIKKLAIENAMLRVVLDSKDCAKCVGKNPTIFQNGIPLKVKSVDYYKHSLVIECE